MKFFTMLALLATLLFALAACSDETGLPGQPSTGGDTSGQANATPTINPNVTPLVAEATSTPVPPPPTPTPRPKPTQAPTNPPQPTSPGATAAPTQAPSAGIDTPMIDIPAGSFQMGSDAGNADSKPPHKVDVAAFKMDEFEVTNADFKTFVDATGYKTDAEKAGEKGWVAFADGKDNHPVVKVSWNDANAFCQWAGKRLPTEAEWEYAARGTQDFTYPYGNDYDSKKQNGKDSGLRGTVAVGSFPAGASPFKILDMAGNVAEWTASHPEHYPGNTTNSKLYGDNLYILRGGGWFSAPDQLTTFYRNSAVPTTANDDLGFRCAK
jgi:formylglycine-generating enzyme required for sulfatase activity